MSNELETVGLASIGGLSPGGKADLSGEPCRNCGEMVNQRHCPRCGQLAASFHRPFIALVWDSISDSFALDSRLSRTLPLLFFRPGLVTRRYVEGRRARYVPPFRLFLLSSLIFYLVAFAFVGQTNWLDFPVAANVQGEQLSARELAALRESVLNERGEVDEARLRALIERVQQQGADEPSPEEGAESVDAAPDLPQTPGEPSAEAQVSERAERIIENPQLFVSSLETWTPRLSLLFVPLTMLAMGMLYFWHRRIYMYDHAIHALHLHSWIYLTATLTMLLGLAVGPGVASAIFFIALPVYVLLSLRGAYRTGYFMSFARMVLLSIFWLMSLIILMIGILAVSALSI